MHELGFQNPFPMEEYLTQHSYRVGREGQVDGDGGRMGGAGGGEK